MEETINCATTPVAIPPVRAIFPLVTAILPLLAAWTALAVFAFAHSAEVTQNTRAPVQSRLTSRSRR